MADEIRIVKHAAAQHNVVFVLGHAHAVLPKELKVWHLPRRLLLEMPYKVSAYPISMLPSFTPENCLRKVKPAQPEQHDLP